MLLSLHALELGFPFRAEEGIRKAGFAFWFPKKLWNTCQPPLSRSIRHVIVPLEFKLVVSLKNRFSGVFTTFFHFLCSELTERSLFLCFGFVTKNVDKKSMNPNK